MQQDEMKRLIKLEEQIVALLQQISLSNFGEKAEGGARIIARRRNGQQVEIGLQNQ